MNLKKKTQQWKSILRYGQDRLTTFLKPHSKQFQIYLSVLTAIQLIASSFWFLKFSFRDGFLFPFSFQIHLFVFLFILLLLYFK